MEIVVVDVEDSVKFLAEKVEEHHTLPFPFRKVRYDGSKVLQFDLAGTRYILNQDMAVCRVLCEKMGMVFEGQGLSTLLFTIIEQVYPKGLPKSWLSPPVHDTLLLEGVKARAHYGLVNGFTLGELQELHEQGRVRVLDINKCFTACMYDLFDDWILGGFGDEWEEYDGRPLTLGHYFVETEDTTLMHGTNLYSNTMLAYAASEGIPFTITHQLRTARKADRRLFTKIIDRIMEIAGGDMSILKALGSRLSGYLGKHKKTTHTFNINNDFEQALNWFKEQGRKGGKRIHIDDFEVGGSKYYTYGTITDTMLSETNIPMYIQVLDFANIRLHQMAKAMGGKLAFRKTDCAVTVDGGVMPPLSDALGGYKLAELPTRMGQPNVHPVRGFPGSTPGWKEHAEVRDSSQWEEMLRIATEEGGLLIAGEAGTGKTFASRNIAAALGGSIKRLAPTHKACLVLRGAQTIHSFLGIGTDGCINISCVKLIKGRQILYVLIDEMSMINEFLWKRLVELKRLTGLIFILVGDRRQCKPIEVDPRNEGRKYFDHPAVRYLVNFNRVELTVVHRYDMELKKALNHVMDLDQASFPYKETRLNISYYNGTRKYVNHICNLRYKPEEGCFLIEACKTDEYTQDVLMHVGLPLISRESTKDGAILNNEDFEVVSCDPGRVVCRSMRMAPEPDEEGRDVAVVNDVVVETRRFHESFLMAYCITTHKSQGNTFDVDFTIWEWHAMEEELRYTSMSRGKRVGQISIAAGGSPAPPQG
jgi:hypothetical protein